MSYEDALNKAKKIIDSEIQTIIEIVELNDSWVFLGGAKAVGERIIGARSLRIYKETNKIENFSIPPIENLDLLDDGTTIFKLEM